MKYWLTLVILVVLALAAWYVLNTRQATVEEAVVQAPVVEQAPEVVEQPSAEPEPVVVEPVVEPVAEEPPLPALADSDPLAIETLTGLVGEESVQQVIVSEDVIPRWVATVDALSSRQVPGPIKAVEGPGGDFEATAHDDPERVILNETGDPVPQYVLDPANFPRYTPYVEMLEAADTGQILSAYRRHQPLFEEAFRQLGYPEGDFDTRLKAVIDELLATPEVTAPVLLIKPEAYYLYADESLESLSAGQKALIRMGPDNAARVKVKLTEIRAAL